MAYQETKTYSERPKFYQFFSMGTGYSFNPTKKANIDGQLSTQLELHKLEVRMRKRADTFILDNNGKYLPI
jgi:hypothetical protein